MAVLRNYAMCCLYCVVLGSSGSCYECLNIEDFNESDMWTYQWLWACPLSCISWHLLQVLVPCHACKFFFLPQEVQQVKFLDLNLSILLFKGLIMFGSDFFFFFCSQISLHLDKIRGQSSKIIFLTFKQPTTK